MSSEDSIKQASELKGDGKYDEAVKLLKGILTHEPRNVEAWYEMADTYTWAGDYGRALACFEQVAALRPDHPMVREKVREMSPVVERDPLASQKYRMEKMMYAAISRFNFGA